MNMTPTNKDLQDILAELLSKKLDEIPAVLISDIKEVLKKYGIQETVN